MKLTNKSRMILSVIIVVSLFLIVNHLEAEKKDGINIEIKDYVWPEFTEEEILNLTEEEILYYGELIKQGRLVSVEAPNYLIEEFGLDTYQVGGETRRYFDVGRVARKSADTLDEAYEIVREEFYNSKYTDLEGYLAGDNVSGYYDDIRVIGENDDLWIFKIEQYWGGKYDTRLTTIVYKKDYYEQENHVANFELSNESVRHFFLSRTSRLSGESYCIGEYVNYIDGDESRFYYAKYYLNITGFDMITDYYSVRLICEYSWITLDGHVEIRPSGYGGTIKEVIFPRYR